MDRRAFLGALGTSAAALRWPAAAGAAQDPVDVPALDPVGLQLYTVRGEMRTSVEATLARVAQIGYREVEFAGYFDRPAKTLRATLDANALAAPAAHVDLRAVRQRLPQLLDDAATLGHRFLIVAWIDAAERRTLDDVRRLAAAFDTIGEATRKAGIQFAYHNHDFEFASLAGELPYDVLLAETDPALVKFEMDLYWITHGGQDPLAYFARHPGRFPLVHVKDRTRDARMADVGAGVIDFAKIFARHRTAGIAHYFVEHDNPPDPFASIEASFRHLRSLKI